MYINIYWKYSNLSEKDKNDLILWNEYLIYSVIFGINTQIVDELIELIYFEKAFINTECYSEIGEKQIIYIDNTEYSYSSDYSKTNYCKYFDYISKDTNFNNIISLEYWNGTKKIYIGTKIAPDRIKIQPTYNEQME